MEELLRENNISEDLQEIISGMGDRLAELEYNLENSYNADTQQETKEIQQNIRRDLNEVKYDITAIKQRSLNNDEKYVIERFEQRIEAIEDICSCWY
jgi:hypothetical protein